jgi:hypothetical protein
MGKKRVLGELACLLHLVVGDDVESCEGKFTHGRALDVVLKVRFAVSAQCGRCVDQIEDVLEGLALVLGRVARRFTLEVGLGEGTEAVDATLAAERGNGAISSSCLFGLPLLLIWRGCLGFASVVGKIQKGKRDWQGYTRKRQKDQGEKRKHTFFAWGGAWLVWLTWQEEDEGVGIREPRDTHVLLQLPPQKNHPSPPGLMSEAPGLLKTVVLFCRSVLWFCFVVLFRRSVFSHPLSRLCDCAFFCFSNTSSGWPVSYCRLFVIMLAFFVHNSLSGPAVAACSWQSCSLGKQAATNECSHPGCLKRAHHLCSAKVNPDEQQSYCPDHNVS